MTSNARLPGSIFFFLVVVGSVRAHSYAAQMPQPIATHFRGGGMANGWQSQLVFYATELGVAVLASFIAFGIPSIIGALPISLINMSNKEYWFGPERRENTLAFFAAQFTWFGCALLAFLLFVNELVFRANLTSPHRLNTTAFTVAMAVFLTFVAFWTARLVIHFSKTQK
jgi:hypothetical protein